ncbi:hypothetical protein CDD81_6961 [Ophiocordyceps australis]|uniref:Condensation domain-containing protein n=1 Tax=Ophiocordyceps australis TaxID=1399860 RepID=A0A2C5YFJ8_9HYPO|nr:hypothetical protein CDD81_6961 [Ophiocordyceps australis]
MQYMPDTHAHVVGVPDGIAGHIVVAIVSLAHHTSTTAVAAAARALGPRYALDAVYTLASLHLDGVPVTALGKPKRGLLRDAVLKHRRALTPKGHDTLQHSLASSWEQLTGHRPAWHQPLPYLADSIMLLRYCDAVVRNTGHPLYFQDLKTCHTIDEQAALLLQRQSNPLAVSSPSPPSIQPLFHHQALYRQTPASPDQQSLGLAARHALSSLSLSDCRIQATLPLRSALRRMILGQRPQSFHMRLVFRIPDSTISRVRDALQSGLASRPVLRALACCPPPNDLPFLIIVAHHPQLLNRQIHHATVPTEDEAHEYCIDAPDDKALMFVAHIVHVEQTGHIHLCLRYNHAIVDATFLLQWHRHLTQLIRHANDSVPPSPSLYLHWVDLYEQLRHGLAARQAVAFHAARLRGISRLAPQILWPPQRAPGWMVSSSPDAPHAEQRSHIRNHVWQGTWHLHASDLRFPRRSRIVRLDALPHLEQHCSITPALLGRSALALFSALQTHQCHAVFTCWESARSWPFVPSWLQHYLPPAEAVDGPTVARVLNMVQLRRDETVGQFLTRLTREADEARQHEHADWDAIITELREEGPVAQEASFRQSFVWDVSMGAALTASPQWHQGLEPVSRHDWPDFGLCWNMFRATCDSIFIVASWDTAQMTDDDVDKHCDSLAHVLRLLARQDNWEQKVGCLFPDLGRQDV